MSFQPVPETKTITTRRDSDGQKWVNDYCVKGFLGEGSFSKVKLVSNQGREFAMKVLKRSFMKTKKNGLEALQRELAGLRTHAHETHM